MEETKICNKCNRELPIDKFRLVKGQFHNPYYLGQCKECEYKSQRKHLEERNRITFSDHLELLIDFQYKKIKPERILDLSKIKIIPIGTDEIFVKLMDYKNAWLSNYGRIIGYSDGQYSLKLGSHDKNGNLFYCLMKDEYSNGGWKYSKSYLYAAKAVIDEFIVNPDKSNNVYIWHSGLNREDNYYRNLYPLNREQYRVVKSHFLKTGNDSENFIRSVINEVKFKPDDWSKKAMRPVMCKVGYRGSEDVNCKSETYLRWHDMMNRCYNEKFHARQPQYKNCTVCEEWHNFCNYRLWYEGNKYGDEPLDLDKDILFKGNTIYSPETCVLVPHIINTLFLNGKSNRGECPIGVFMDSDKRKYRACVAFGGMSVKLGTFDTADAAFARYKEYKEDLIKDMAEQYKDMIPHKVYEAMMNWKIEVTD